MQISGLNGLGSTTVVVVDTGGEAPSVVVTLAGTQTGSKEDYDILKDMCDDGTVILDDANPLELSKYIVDKKADLFIGGVKERPVAYKMGVGFCDHNHERKIPLAGFEGMVHFAREVYGTVKSPVWGLLKKDER